MTDPRQIAASLTPAERKAMLTKSGSGDYSSRTFERLLNRRLVDDNFRFTDLGWNVREAVLHGY